MRHVAPLDVTPCKHRDLQALLTILFPTSTESLQVISAHGQNKGCLHEELKS